MNTNALPHTKKDTDLKYSTYTVPVKRLLTDGKTGNNMQNLATFAAKKEAQTASVLYGWGKNSVKLMHYGHLGIKFWVIFNGLEYVTRKGYTAVAVPHFKKPMCLPISEYSVYMTQYRNYQNHKDRANDHYKSQCDWCNKTVSYHPNWEITY